MRRIVLALGIAAALAASALPVLAAYSTTWQVVESNGNTYVMLAVSSTTNVSYMASNGFIDADGKDTLVTVGGSPRPRMLAGDRMMFAVALNAGQTINATFSTDNASTDHVLMTGYAGYVTTTAHDDIQPLAADFTLTWVGYFDATRTGSIAMRGATTSGDYGIDVSVAGTVRGRVTTAAGTSTLTKAAASGVHTIVLSKTGAVIDLTVDAVSPGTVNDANQLGGNGNSLVSLQHGPAVYTSSLVLTKGGVETLRYEPDGIVSGTTLPDQAGTAQDGTITWGANQAGVTATLGSLVSDSQPGVGSAGTVTVDDRAPALDQPQWNPTPAASYGTPIDTAVTIFSNSSGFGVHQLWVLGALASMLAAVILCMKFIPGHLFVAVGAAMALASLFTSMHILPFWSLFILGTAFAASLVMERQGSW